MKRRTKAIALASSLLVGVSMIGVGFATWVISNDTDATVTGSVIAETVVDKALKSGDFSITQIDGAAAMKNEEDTFTGPDIHYGATDAEIEGAWFYNDDRGTENLSFTITFSVSAEVGEIAIEFEANGSQWAEAVRLGYVEEPTYSLAENEYFALDGESIKQTASFEGENQTLTLTVTFAWGGAFGGENPYTFFNRYAYGTPMSTYGEAWQEGGAYENLRYPVNGDYAHWAIADMAGKLEGVRYTFLFTAFNAE